MGRRLAKNTEDENVCGHVPACVYRGESHSHHQARKCPGQRVPRLCLLSSSSVHFLLPPAHPRFPHGSQSPPSLANRQVEEAVKERFKPLQRAMWTSTWVAPHVRPWRRRSGQEEFLFCLQVPCELRTMEGSSHRTFSPVLSEPQNSPELALLSAGRQRPAGPLGKPQKSCKFTLPGRGVTPSSSELRLAA